VNRQKKITTKISVAIAGIFERYTYNIAQQDASHKDKSKKFIWREGYTDTQTAR
jgi:hypothetical protein